jgi:23S rRNA (guanine745-N1)-methyltransferase
MLICPLCKTKLLEEPKRFCCMQGHAYDKAKSGYVNLLVGSSMKSHGDDEAMVNSRTRFLSQGHYDPLRKELIRILKELDVASLADLGCGEGSYTNAIQQALQIPVFGIDLSKSALKIASKANPNVNYALANITKAPLADQSVEAVLSVFSPYDLNECARIASWYLILVRPLPKHLDELKAVLYDKVIDNPMPDTVLPQTVCILKQEVIFPMKLDQASLSDLLDMTPYAHTSPLCGLQKVKALQKLTVTAQFQVSVFRFLHE